MVFDVRFRPSVLMLLIKTSRRSGVSHETRVLDDLNSEQAMFALAQQELQALGKRPDLIVSCEWLLIPGTGQWIPVKALLELLEARHFVAGEYRIRTDDTIPSGGRC